MKDYHVILRVADNGGQLNHVPLVQYWLIRYEIGASVIKRLTLTMPRKEIDGTIHPISSIEMNVDSFYNGHGFSNADVKRWLQHKHWGKGTLLLFRVSFKKNHLDYKLLGRVDKKF